jgi:glutathione-specific gamma-glutamylcyclotransferase
MSPNVLTRALLEAGGIEALIARAASGLVLLTEQQRAESLRQTLATRAPGEPVWVFGYGSLIWNPTVQSIERRTGRIEGWHRAFCLNTQVGRGTLDNPGLMLGLDRGGSCTGVALRLAEETFEAELALLWRREMLSGAYVPRWLEVTGGDGARVGQAIAFTIDPATQQYAGKLAQEIVVQRLATASGELGSAADYLFQTCESLRDAGIPDPDLDRLADAVRTARALDAAG